MTTETKILTDEQIGDLYHDWYCFFKDNPGSAALCIQAIEQAVLQSPEVQAWKRDAKRLDKLEQTTKASGYAVQICQLRHPDIKAGITRIEVKTGCGAGVWEGSSESGSLREAIDAAMEKKA